MHSCVFLGRLKENETLSRVAVDEGLTCCSTLSQQGASRGLRPGLQVAALAQTELDPLGRHRGSADMEMVRTTLLFTLIQRNR